MGKLARSARNATTCIKRAGGWETMEMVQRYAHLSADHLAQWVQSVSNDGCNLAVVGRCKPERGCKISLATPRITGAAGRNRTHDPLVRSQVLYPAELQPRKTKLYTIFVYFGRGKYLKTSYFASLAELNFFFCLPSTKSATMPEQLQNGKPFLHLIVIFFESLSMKPGQMRKSPR